MCVKFTTFWKEGWGSKRNYFRNYCFGNRLLLKTETSRRCCFRTPFVNQRVNGFQTPLKIARHHYYPSFPWILVKLSWKKTALLWSKILRLFANTLTPDDKYSCRNMQNARTSNAFISKTQDFSLISYSISEMCIKFRKFGKKGWVS